MNRHEVKSSVERDADGRIVRIGASWGETRPFFEDMLIRGGVMSFFAVLLGLLWASFGGMNPFLGLGGVGLVLCPALLFLLPPPERALYFHADGRMEVPFGLFFRSDLGWMTGDHSYIVSIEARLHHQDRETNDKLYEVAVLFNTGDIVYLSRNCFEWVAIKAAAQLTHGLNQLRREQADPNGYEGAWASVA